MPLQTKPTSSILKKKPSSSQHATPFYYNLNDCRLVTNEGPNIPDHRPTKRTTTLATTLEATPCATCQKITKQLTTNKNSRLSSNALLERAATNNANQGTTSKYLIPTKEHNA